MRIEKGETSITAISDLNPGDVFMYDYEYYIKTFPFKGTNGDGICKVVNLDSGRPEALNCGTRVMRVNAKLVVED